MFGEKSRNTLGRGHPRVLRCSYVTCRRGIGSIRARPADGNLPKSMMSQYYNMVAVGQETTYRTCTP